MNDNYRGTRIIIYRIIKMQTLVNCNDKNFPGTILTNEWHNTTAMHDFQSKILICFKEIPKMNLR